MFERPEKRTSCVEFFRIMRDGKSFLGVIWAFGKIDSQEIDWGLQGWVQWLIGTGVSFSKLMATLSPQAAALNLLALNGA